MSIYAERIRELRRLLSLSQTEFGHAVGVTRSVIVNCELNRTEPNPIFIDHLCDVFEVNREWIRGEDVEPFDSGMKDFREMRELYKELDPRWQRFAIEQMRSLAKAQKEDK